MNLIKDKAEEISSIVWRVDGKVKEINRPTTSTKKKLTFDYDAMGNRIAKHVFDNQTGLLERSTYYILDAQGNQLTTYEHVVDNSTANFVLKERHIFGSSRLGMLNEDVNVLTAQIGQNVQHEVGKKYYELSNHLGNVLSVFTDLKIPQSSNTVTVSSYRVFIAGTTDYSPFGVELDGRTQSPEAYRYSFQGQEHDDEIKGEGNSVNYQYRMHDPRVGRFFVIDKLSFQFPHYSPFSFSGNRLIDAIELEGLEEYIITKTYTKNNYGYRVSLNIVYVKEENRKESSPGANDKNRQVDYFVNGTLQSIHNIPAGSEEIKQIARKKITFGKNRSNLKERTLSEAIESGFDIIEGSWDMNGYPTSDIVRWKDITLPIDLKNFIVYYNTNDANEISIDEEKSLKETVKYLGLCPEVSVTLIGTTSRKGNDNTNLDLSKKRADRLEKRMLEIATEMGYDSEEMKNRIETIGRGSQSAREKNKALDNDDSSDRKVFIRFNGPK